MMMRVKKLITGICTALVFSIGLAGASPVQAAEATPASNISVTLGTTDNAKAGDKVTARIVLGDNPGITTFAVKLAYDSDYLTYTGATWANAVSSDSSNVQLISEVTENGGPVLNISSILSSTYSNNETMVTLDFTVREDYTTMPVTLTNREITNSSYGTVTPSVVVDATAGRPNSNNDEDDEDDEDPDDDEDDEVLDDEDEEDTEDTEEDSEEENTGGGTDNNKTDSGNKNSSTGGKLDRTPKTGAADVRLMLGSAVVVFLAIAGICFGVTRKKRP